MKICIDATPIGIKTTDKGGVYRYILELVKALNNIDNKNHYTLFFNFFRKEHFSVFQDTIKNLQLRNNFHVILSRFPNKLRNLINPPVELLAGKFDIFHGCFDFLPPFFMGKGLVTIHDTRYLENSHEETNQEWIQILNKTPAPQFYKQDYLSRSKLFNYLRTNIRNTTKRAAFIITVSKYCKSQITHLLDVPQERVKVIYHGINSRFTILSNEEVRHTIENLGIKKPYILYTGKFDPLKNIFRLLEAFSKATLNLDVILVMVGPINWFYFIVLKKIKQLGIEDKVIFTDFITDEEIVALYNGASAFLMPSLYEGFGIPLIEAMACGTPVITSNISSIPEIVGDAGLLVDPFDVDWISDALVQVLKDRKLRKSLINGGLERAKLFSWENTAQETLGIYKEVCKE